MKRVFKFKKGDDSEYFREGKLVNWLISKITKIKKGEDLYEYNRVYKDNLRVTLMIEREK